MFFLFIHIFIYIYIIDRKHIKSMWAGNKSCLHNYYKPCPAVSLVSVLLFSSHYLKKAKQVGSKNRQNIHCKNKLQYEIYTAI